MSPLRRSVGFLAAALMAGVLAAVPLERTAACSCADTELVEAVAQAEAAFVGRLVDRAGPVVRDPFGDEVAWTWRVERSRDPGSPATITTLAPEENGANCGVVFATGERWLILAHGGEGGLHTNGCMANQRIDGGEPQADALVAELIPHAVAGPDGQAAGLHVPAPVVVAGGVALLLALVWLAALRLDSR